MKQIKLTPIDNGTVLDHLPAGKAFMVIKLLNLNGNSTVSVVTNTESASLGKKDLVFIEGKELNEEEIEKVGLIASGSTLNIIKNKTSSLKKKIEMPKEVPMITTERAYTSPIWYTPEG